MVVQSASPIYEHVQDDLLSNTEELQACQLYECGCIEIWNTYENQDREIVIPSSSPQHKVPAIKTKEYGNRSKEERDVCHSISQWLESRQSHGHDSILSNTSTLNLSGSSTIQEVPVGDERSQKEVLVTPRLRTVSRPCTNTLPFPPPRA